MSEQEKTADSKVTRLMRQPAHDREPEEAKQPAARVQRDPLAQVGGRTGSASAEVHASILSRATDARPGLAPESLLRLQRAYGNRYVSRVVELSRKGHGEGDVTPEIEAAIQRARGAGQALDGGARAQMEPALGADFSGVRVHTGSQADTLNRDLSARAFTTGQDIFFKQGEYSPGSSNGRELLAHELTHVVQQGGDRVRRKLTVGAPDDQYEQEADRTAGQVMRSISEAAQRQSVPEEEKAEEEPLQAKLDKGGIQRQAEGEEEEEPLQAKLDKGGIQRQAEGEEEDEPLQAKLDEGGVQRQAEEDEEEEEPLQVKRDEKLTGPRFGQLTV